MKIIIYLTGNFLLVRGMIQVIYIQLKWLIC